MKYITKFFQTEEELMNECGLDVDKCVITGVEFNPDSREIHYTIRSTEETDKTVEVNGNSVPRRHKINNAREGNFISIKAAGEEFLVSDDVKLSKFEWDDVNFTESQLKADEEKDSSDELADFLGNMRDDIDKLNEKLNKVEDGMITELKVNGETVLSTEIKINREQIKDIVREVYKEVRDEESKEFAKTVTKFMIKNANLRGDY